MSDTDDRRAEWREPVMTRERALVLSREFVLGLYPERDDRSHPRTTAEMREMLSQMLAIAEFLNGAPNGVDPDILSKILEVVRSIDGQMQ